MLFPMAVVGNKSRTVFRFL